MKGLVLFCEVNACFRAQTLILIYEIVFAARIPPRPLSVEACRLAAPSKAGVREAVAGAGMQCMPSLCEVFWRFVCRGIWGMLAVDKDKGTRLVLLMAPRVSGWTGAYGTC